MAQELGRVQRPPAAQYHDRRKLLLAPLLYAPPDAGEDGAAIVARYWEQVATQTAALESSLGPVSHVYCESLPEGGEEGLKYLEIAAQPSYQLVKSRVESGAVLEETEDRDAILEMVDLQRMLMLPLASENVAQRLQEWYAETNRRRYRRIADRIKRHPRRNRNRPALNRRASPGPIPLRHRSLLRLPAGPRRIPPLAPKLAIRPTTTPAR